jgi:formylglycine-generating enzyme
LMATSMRYGLVLFGVFFACLGSCNGWTQSAAPNGMRFIPAGEFQMGSLEPQAWPDELPAHRVSLTRPYWLDATEVTNAQFKRFVLATGYKTVAERPINLVDLMRQVPPGTAAPAKEMLLPGSLVFEMPGGEVNLRDISQWWHWTVGANWRAPEGPKSSLKGRDNHPVVHLAWDDARAYCQWANKRLPTEAEWERAARGGIDGLPYVWGSEKPQDANPKSAWFANIWQGVFPSRNTATDGHERTAPVGRFKPNPYGLFDMAGNVWEWTADWYDPHAYNARAGRSVVDPTGPSAPFGREHRRVQRGGSFLCHDSYCSRYRPGARQGAAADSGSSHAGARCAKSLPVAQPIRARP